MENPSRLFVRRRYSVTDDYQLLEDPSNVLFFRILRANVLAVHQVLVSATTSALIII